MDVDSARWAMNLFGALVLTAPIWIILLISLLDRYHDSTLKNALVSAEEEAKRLAPFEARLGGRRISRLEELPSEDAPYFRFIVTAYDVLPQWMIFSWGKYMFQSSKDGSQTELYLALLNLHQRLQGLPRGCSISVVAGELELTLKRQRWRIKDSSKFEATEALVGLAEHCIEMNAKELPLALAQMVHRDQRLCAEALHLLIDRFSDHPATEGATLHAKSSPDARLRALVAARRGKEDRRELRTLALDKTVPDGVRARAINALIRLREHETLLECAPIAPQTVLVSLIGALAQSRDPRAAGVVTGLLQHADLPVIIEAAADALARIGDRSALLALLDVSKHAKLLDDSSTKTAVLIAIELIQERLGGAQGKGGLALSDPDSKGKLSMGDETQGTLQTPED